MYTLDHISALENNDDDDNSDVTMYIMFPLSGMQMNFLGLESVRLFVVRWMVDASWELCSPF